MLISFDKLFIPVPPNSGQPYLTWFHDSTRDCDPEHHQNVPYPSLRHFFPVKKMFWKSAQMFFVILLTDRNAPEINKKNTYPEEDPEHTQYVLNYPILRICSKATVYSEH